jgi:hypothetical protein
MVHAINLAHLSYWHSQQRYPSIVNSLPAALTPEEFAETITFVEFAAIKNIGIHRLQTFFSVFKEVCPDAADLWTARNR